MENFIFTFDINESVCDSLIQYHKNNIEYKYEGTSGVDGKVWHDIKESIDVTFFNSSSDLAIKSYFSELQRGFNEYIKKYNLKHMRLQTELANNIQFYPPGGGYKAWHWERDNGNENRQLVYMTYLNTVTDNGGTEWFYQNFKTEAKKGRSVIWPADFTHMHRGIVSATQEKWIATGWFVLN